MLAEQMRQMFHYNDWAWKRVFRSVAALPEEAYRAERPFFFDTIHNLLVHCLGAERLWLSRCLGNSPKSFLRSGDFADFTAVHVEWATVTDDWDNFLRGLRDEDLLRPIDYTTTEGRGHTLPLVTILQQVTNHATEHRGQLTPVLSHLGVPTEPLDFLFFALGGSKEQKR